ncbi:hypothetical protein PIIN_06593 [Serendipita indica DSM 11827]|uniref:F-box domain-containing protein n=1 Tax=Serendipita indica (strain DSM 11827) TaxID=1109443 RepID=G4TMW3_SERID|nr:hypothetical protein PIIN_06593 [Serendipita indica DSM 11827]
MITVVSYAQTKAISLDDLASKSKDQERNLSIFRGKLDYYNIRSPTWRRATVTSWSIPQMASSAVERTPVEIWKRIFELYLGQSLLSPEEPTLRGYQRFLADEGEMLNKFIATEKKIRILRLVCHSWRELVDTLADKIVISHCDEYDWPPGRSREEADYISYYIQCESFGSVVSLDDPVGLYRGDIEWVWRSDSPEYSNFYQSAPLRRITRITTHNTELLPSDLTQGSENVWYLSIGYNGYLQCLAIARFVNLRVLRIYAKYPLYEIDHKVDRTLPNLCCLMLEMRLEDEPIPSSRNTSLSGWRFPKLSMFNFDISSSDGICPTSDIVEFLQRHASTLQEIDIGPLCAGEVVRYIDWSRFSYLKGLVGLDLDTLPDALTSISHGILARYSIAEILLICWGLTIELDMRPAANIVVYLVERLEVFHEAFSHITFRLPWFWATELRNAQELVYNCHEYPSEELTDALISYRGEMLGLFAVVERARLPVVDRDGKTASSSEARALISFLQS